MDEQNGLQFTRAMGKAKPVELPSQTFSKQGDATKFFKDMLNDYEDGQRINPEDSRLLFELIQRHPDQKIGIGIEYFYRARNPEQPTSCFHIMRLNGEKTDFSYPKCISGKKPTANDHYYRACRFAVSAYLTRAKNELFTNGPVVCVSTGELVSKESSDYRHTDPAFKTLVEDFRRSRGLNISFDLFTEDRDMQYNVRFKDQSIANDFIEYHKQYANLAIFRKHF